MKEINLSKDGDQDNCIFQPLHLSYINQNRLRKMNSSNFSQREILIDKLKKIQIALPN